MINIIKISDRELQNHLCGSGKIFSAASAELRTELINRTINSVRRGVWSAINICFNNSNKKTRAADMLEDLIQDSANLILQKIPTWNQSGSLSAWAFKISRNNAINYFKSWNVRLILECKNLDSPVSIGTDESGSVLADLIPDNNTIDPEKNIITHELISKITHFILNCPSDLAAQTVSLIANGIYRSISGVATSLDLYPYEIKNAISPYLKEISELMTNDPDVQNELCKIERKCHSIGLYLFPLRQYPPIKFELVK